MINKSFFDTHRELLAEVLVASVLVLVGVLTRTIWNLGPNVETITLISFALGWLFRHRILALLCLALTLGLSDSILGNSNILLFTWSAFFLGMAWSVLASKAYADKTKQVAFFSFSGISFVIFFFLWTNFGVVVLTNMYSKDLAGLIASYINGLPFLRNQIISNLIFLPFGYLLIESSLNWLKRQDGSIQTLKPQSHFSHSEKL